MPVDVNLPKEGMIYQREQYQKGGIGKWYWDFRDKAILKRIGDEEMIVDIGCGEGILIEKMIHKFPYKKITGIDISLENIEICRKHYLDVYSGNVYELPFDDNSVDCVLFTEVVEHLDNPESAIKGINRILKKGGKLILVFPNDVVFKLARMLTFKFKEAFYDEGHVKQWNPSEMINVLKRNGFETIYNENIPFYLWVISLHSVIVGRKL